MSYNNQSFSREFAESICSRLLRLLLPIVSLLMLFAGSPSYGQDPIPVTEDLMKSVIRGAETFSPKEGNPPVYRAYKRDPASSESVLMGYLFETPDWPPEEIGYSAPVDVLVGLDMKGTITGIEVLHYIESYRSIRGDFINSEYFPNQFSAKNITEGFRVGRDIDGISRATITSWAVARGVRDAARRVAQVYLPDSEYVAATSGDAIALRVFENQSWQEMKDTGLVKDWSVIQPDGTELKLTLAFMGHDGLGEIMIGIDDYSRADRDASNRSREGRMLLVGIDGDSSRPFRQERLAVKQGEEIFPIERRRFVYAGSADYGKIKDQVRFAGAMVLMPELDLAEPFSVLYSTEGVVGEFGGIHEIEYQVPPLALALSQGGTIPAELLPEVDEERDQFAEEGFWTSLLTNAPVFEVVAILVICAMVMTAFLKKSASIRWATLAVTLVYLGWMDGGFVSVSHITNGIKLGPSLFLNDLPLLLIIVFTVVTTLFWGRIFCSSLCPFGALQDFMTRFIPKRWQYQVPQAIHDKALYLKYGILAFLVVMAVAYADLSLFQYFEPFGTIFYFSQSLLLWAILAVFLIGATFIPRFYCRYACPLGAALGVASMISPWRIKRVEQCDVCKVCEHACPTGAIRGPEIDFKECVRCDICDYKLIARSGVYKHDMDTVKVRIKDWQPATA
ncbi:MAG: 4Fe-4S binding protein [Pseudomonadales bacterium]|nr:4Fe-4S binding protein [Pseudomonadales bacterium]